MKYIVEYQVDEESTILVEVDEPATAKGTLIPTSRKQDTIVKATLSFEEALSKIKPTANALLKTLRDLRADEVEVEFGLKLSAEAGAVIASSGIEANYSVKLKWNNQPTPKSEA